MKIKISKNSCGWQVYRLVGGRWKYWLPHPYDHVRGEDLFKYYKTAEEAKSAAIREKQESEKEKDIICEI